MEGWKGAPVERQRQVGGGSKWTESQRSRSTGSSREAGMQSQGDEIGILGHLHPTFLIQQPPQVWKGRCFPLPSLIC